MLLKFKHNTLEYLENDVWDDELRYDSYLVSRIHQLRKIPLNKFSVEDIRIMISQDTGIIFLVPLAIDILQNDLFAEGDNYAGDLLKSVLDIKPFFWAEHRSLWQQINELIDTRRNEIAKIKSINMLNFDDALATYL